jgi:hypothetical protein
MTEFLPLAAIANQFINEAIRYDRMVNGRTWETARRARELTTVKLCSHRQAGHTHAVKELATKSTMIVCPNKIQLVNYGDLYVVPAGQTIKANCSSLGHDMIIVDMASLLSRRQMDMLYDKDFLEYAFPHNVLPLIVMFQ